MRDILLTALGPMAWGTTYEVVWPLLLASYRFARGEVLEVRA